MLSQEHNDLRQRVLRGEHVTSEELAAALKQIRGARNSASSTSTASRTSRAKQTLEEASSELDDLLKGFTVSKGEKL